MTKEQKELLYSLADFYLKEFNIRMIDTWSHTDYKLSREYIEKINDLEKEYKSKYGELPKWETIDVVQKAKKDLEKEIMG